MKNQKVIALLTDFGLNDAYVASMKGVIHSIADGVQVIDITHSIEPQNIDQAAYVLWSTYKYFPEGTIFICVVDPGVGAARKIICAEGNSYVFLAPDNGILKFILGSCKISRIRVVNNQQYFQPEVSPTFHGRDIFSPVAAHITNGIKLDKLGPQTTPLFHAEHFIEVPLKPNEEYVGKIIHVDHFGNIVTNLHIKSKVVNKMNLILGKNAIKEFSKTYSDDKSKKPFLIIGSTGLLEIAIKNNSASKLLKPTLNQSVRLVIV